MHGGTRAGAGRKKGRQNKVNAAVRARALASGESPLDFLLRYLRDPSQTVDVRMEMAKAAAPYVHPRLQAVAYSGDPAAPVHVHVQHTDARKPLSKEELMAELQRRGLPTTLLLE